MKAIERHLYSRNGHFYCRSAIPRKFQRILPIRETVIALGLSDRREARIVAAQLNQAEQEILQDFHARISHCYGRLAYSLVLAKTSSCSALSPTSSDRADAAKRRNAPELCKILIFSMLG